MVKRLLVTGGSGFVLSNVVYAWLESSEDTFAVVLDLPRAWDKHVREFFAPFQRSGRLRFQPGSVTDPDIWASLDQDFTHIVSGAALTPTPQDEVESAARILEVNLFGTIRTLEFARNLPRGQLQRFVFGLCTSLRVFVFAGA